MPSKVSPRRREHRVNVCRECGRHEREAGPMSARDLCHDCSTYRTVASADQLRDRSGPFYDEWRRAMIAHAVNLASGR